jgi:hypothetical protein
MHKAIMKQFRTILTVAMLCLAATAIHAKPPEASLESQAAAFAAGLAGACPVAAYDDEAAFQACTNALRKMTLPLLPAIAWGGDQPDKQIKKKGLTHFNSQVFQTMYLPLFTFTGRWSLDEDKRSHSPIIRVEAYFRNGLPSGDFPYPFWHSSEKWHAYETANEIRFYLDPRGRIFIATRDAAGSEQGRGPYAPAMTPAFDKAWQWQDANGNLQPHVSLFSARYSRANPYLPDLDKTYRSFALRIRDQSCLNCHTPANTAEQDRLVLLQTPLHAAGEIDNVIKAVKTGEMPQDDIGLRKDIPDKDRAAVLNAAVTFRDELALADKWESAQSR